jgi:predicted transposase/invertase (TIGR01784 family)
MLSKFLDPKNNVAFLKIFGTEKNKDILIHFLNDVVKFNGGARIQDVTFLKTIQDPEIKAQKTSVVDVLCQDQKGNRYIVEMQVAEEKGFTKRAQYYASKTYSSQLMIKGEYHTLKAVIFLAIADFIMFPKKKGFKSDHVILDKESHENDLKDFSFTFLELPKFTKGIDELSNMIEKWVYFFKHAEETTEEELQKLIDHDQILSRAYEELDRFSWNEEELRAYEGAEKQEGVRLAQLAKKYDDGKAVGEKIGIEKGEKIGIEKGERIGIQKGEKIGIQKGEKIGIQKGEKIGIEKGKKRALLKVARNLSAKGIKVQEIQKLTGLSQQDVLDLRTKKK